MDNHCTEACSGEEGEESEKKEEKDACLGEEERENALAVLCRHQGYTFIDERQKRTDEVTRGHDRRHISRKRSRRYQGVLVTKKR
jgi:hypothetical protein